ncbi:N/A [soil metagenome]
MAYLREVLASRELLVNLVAREVKGKYRRTVFGQLWSLANPLAMMLVYTIVFSFIFRARPSAGDPSGLDIYPLWLLCGYLPWTYFVRVVTGSISSVIGNGTLIKKVYFPRSVLPLATAGSVGFTWLVEMGVLLVALSIFGAFEFPWVLAALVCMLLLAIFSSGLGMLLAAANVYFRDIQHLTVIAMTLWMYLTPIIYPIELVERAAAEHGQWLLVLYQFNPMERFVNVFRNILYDTRWPTVESSLWCVGSALVMFVIGFVVFQRSERRFAELL